jgi:hypothetical protein
MNQDMVKEKLLKLEEPALDFQVIFSGKKSKRVNGLYKPETREIIIHNKNFEAGDTGDNLLLYTGIHEYAHHMQACAHDGKISGRSHTTEFWAIFHGLLEKAESAGIYHNTVQDDPELVKLTEEIREKYIKQNGILVKQFGEILLKAFDLCKKAGVRYEDYIDRVLRIPRLAANTAVKMAKLDLDPALGSDNMKFLAGIRNEEAREEAAEQLEAGKSPDMVRMAAKSFNAAKSGEDERERLLKEKQRLERTITALTKRLEEIDETLGEG